MIKGGGSKCARCGGDGPCSLEPTVTALIFGGFKANLEYRCAKCEREVVKAIKRMLQQPGGFGRT